MAGNVSCFAERGRKITGVAFNYRSFIAQVGAEPPSFPMIFTKAASSYITKGQKIRVTIPEWSKDGLNYEVELGVIIKETMKSVPPSRVLDHVAGYCTALDMTCKYSLNFARENGLSWTIAKCFDTATPVGDFVSKDKIGDVTDVQLWLKLNGDLRQNGNTREMMWPVTDMLSLMSEYFTLEPGDMVLTGTPAGVGVVIAGDVIQAGIQNVNQIEFHVEHSRR